MVESENVNSVNVSSSKVFTGSKPQDFYGEGYYLRAEGSNYGRKDERGNVLFTVYDEQSYLPRNRQLAGFLKSLYKPKTAVVLGCARGYLVKALRELRVEAVGVDISRWAIENSPADIREHLYVGDICDLSLFQNGTFDLTIALDVFEHITVRDLYTAINEATRITNNVVVIDVPIQLNDLHPDQSSGTDKSHVSVYSQAFWIKEFKNRGYSVHGKDVYTYPDLSQGATIIFKQPPIFGKPAVFGSSKCTARMPTHFGEVCNEPIKLTKKGWVHKNRAVTFDHEVTTVEPVDIIILSYNNLAYLPKCLETLYKNTDYPFKLIVVDNQSTDGSAEWLSFAKSSYPNMVVYFNKQLDSGYAAGINTGLKLSKAKYVCLLNNDVLITQKNWLSLLVEALKKQPENGIASPKLLYPNKFIQYAGATFNEKGECYHIGRFKPASMFTLEREIPTATFACVVIKREVLEQTLGLDEAYLMGTFEDVDFCTRARFNGYKVLYVPSVALYHYEGATQFTRFMDHFVAQQQVNFSLFMRRWSEWIRLNRQAYPEVYRE